MKEELKKKFNMVIITLAGFSVLTTFLISYSKYENIPCGMQGSNICYDPLLITIGILAVILQLLIMQMNEEELEEIE